MPRTLALDEVELVQNATLGATLLWQFGLGYQEERLQQPAPLPFHFLVLPICLHSATLGHLLSTRLGSGLALFASKVGEVREELLAIHVRALALRALATESISVGVRAQLLTVDYGAATVRSNVSPLPDIPTRIKPMLTGAERLGHWLARLEIAHVCSILKVDF